MAPQNVLYNHTLLNINEHIMIACFAKDVMPLIMFICMIPLHKSTFSREVTISSERTLN